MTESHHISLGIAVLAFIIAIGSFAFVVEKGTYLPLDASEPMNWGSLLKAYVVTTLDNETYVYIYPAYISGSYIDGSVITGSNQYEGITLTDDLLAGSGGLYIGTSTIPFLYIAIGSTASLPSPSASYRGQIRIVRAESPPFEDHIYVCLRTAIGTFAWVQLD